MEHILLNGGNSFWLGVTGIFGVEKSTFVENIGVFFANKGHNISVIAVGPTI